MKARPNNSFCDLINDGFGCSDYKKATREECTQCLMYTIQEIIESIINIYKNPKDYIEVSNDKTN